MPHNKQEPAGERSNRDIFLDECRSLNDEQFREVIDAIRAINSRRAHVALSDLIEK